MARVSVVMPFKVTTEEQVEWLIEAIKSVQAQTYQDWELWLVNDASTADLTHLTKFLETFPREKLHKRTNKGVGVATARNTAVRASKSELILPFDADDLLPLDALDTMVDAWDREGHKHGIVYGDIEIFGKDYVRLQQGETYDFRALLFRLYMLVGSLHLREDSIRVGGWKHEMEHGLEDWEYWIALGEIGVCGYYIPHTTYKYRKHTQGRLHYLKQDDDRFKAAMAKMRDLHKNVYEGRLPMACCGKGGAAAPKKSSTPALNASTSSDVRVGMIYHGRQRGSFHIKGKATGTLYKVQGVGKPVIDSRMIAGVLEADVDHILRVGGPGAFRRVD